MYRSSKKLHLLKEICNTLQEGWIPSRRYILSKKYRNCFIAMDHSFLGDGSYFGDGSCPHINHILEMDHVHIWILFWRWIMYKCGSYSGDGSRTDVDHVQEMDHIQETDHIQEMNHDLEMDHVPSLGS